MNFSVTIYFHYSRIERLSMPYLYISVKNVKNGFASNFEHLNTDLSRM